MKEQDECVVWFLGERVASIHEGVTLADSVETLGVDLRTRVKRQGAKEKAMRNVRFSLIKKKKIQKNYIKVGVKKLFRAGVMLARTWEARAVRLAPTERLKLRWQMAAAQGKKSVTSLFLFMEACGLVVEEELSLPWLLSERGSK